MHLFEFLMSLYAIRTFRSGRLRSNINKPSVRAVLYAPIKLAPTRDQFDTYAGSITAPTRDQ